MNRDVKLSFLIAWLILSALILGILAAPFLLSEETISRLSPVCVWKAQFDRECPGCGLTRSFVHLSGGRLGDAVSANRAGPALYSLFLMNELLALAWLSRRLLTRLAPARAEGGALCKS